MILLALDTATPSTVVGVRLPDGTVVEARDDPAEGSRGAHASRLLALAEQALGGAGVGWEALDRIGVGVGPGGFTGLRIGIATARGLALARDLPLVPVSSLEILVEGVAPWQAQATRPGPPRRPGGRGGAVAAQDPVTAGVIDARRGEVFAAAWEGGRRVLAPRAMAPEALARWFTEQGGRARAVGDGAVRFRQELEAVGVAVPADGSEAHRVGAAPLCRLALIGSPTARHGLLPDYRRDPDAKPLPTR